MIAYSDIQASILYTKAGYEKSGYKNRRRAGARFCAALCTISRNFRPQLRQFCTAYGSLCSPDAGRVRINSEIVSHPEMRVRITANAIPHLMIDTFRRISESISIMMISREDHDQDEG